MLKTFLRSATHATDSTFTGCSANSAATMRLRHVKPVALCRSENKHGIQGMEENARVMVSGSILSKQLPVRGVREPSQRVPILSVVGGQRPSERRPIQTRLNVFIISYVIVIIKVDKRIVNYGIVNSECGKSQ